MFIANSNIKTSDIISHKLQRVRQLFAELGAAGVMLFLGAYNYHILLEALGFVGAIQPVWLSRRLLCLWMHAKIV